MEEADPHLPKDLDGTKFKMKNGNRGAFLNCHLGVWGDSDEFGIFVTSETEKIQAMGTGFEDWSARARPAFMELTQRCRLVEPKAYAYAMSPDFSYNKHPKLGSKLEGKLERLAGMWAGVAMIRDMTTDGEIHQDWKDDNNIPNGIIPYGKEFTTAWLVLWQLGVMIEVKKGDGILFYGTSVAQNVVEIVGVRNAIDCGCPQCH